ncbi:sugar transporter SWEET1 isoform X1 [Culex quinquefasciatus]|uniref:sugar transporter SWEET1 isoform X1 n=1 Tax=Culex quinquefasciatus TaxID=7176 RepID=UPI0018E36E48|nr:sugar transporter SWEET1 isoform X1 [Culex quinquefasciatus]
MDNYSFQDVLGTSATISTVLQFLTGSVICHRYIRKKSTGETSGFPFVSGFLSYVCIGFLKKCFIKSLKCFLWLKYGMLTQEHVVIFVNIIGSVLFFSYVLVYFTFSINKRIVIRQFLGACVFIMLCTIYTTYESNKEKAVNVSGLVCCCVGVLFFASPFTKLAHVIHTKNTESLPFPIIIASFIVSLQWFIYGLLIGDKFIQVPNLLGCLLSAIQLMLYVIYPSRSTYSVGPAYQQLRTEEVLA